MSQSTDRVYCTHYEATVETTATGEFDWYLRTFTEAQAATVGAVMTEQGIPLNAAIRLCQNWTVRGCHSDRRYRYRPRLPDAAR